MCLSYNIYYVYTYVIKHHIKIQGEISRDLKKKQVKFSKHFQLNTLSLHKKTSKLTQNFCKKFA